MKNKFTLLALMLVSIVSSSQSIYKSSIDAGGALAINGDIEMLYTIGNTNIQELAIGDIQMSEGFISGNIFYNTLSVETVENSAFEISLFPNPVSDFFQIANLNKEVDIVIFDSTGKEVLRKRNYLSGDIHIEQLSTGVYFIKLIQLNKIITKRLIKN